MQYVKLGKTGIDVSVIALGCWPFAGGAVWGEQDDNVSIATARAALDLGVNFFDTAEGYGPGRSEEVLGRALVGRRQQAVIATKVSADHLTAQGVAEACEASLKRLQTDYIDLYQIHWPNWNVPLEETVGALQRLKQQGKIRAIAVCNFGVKDMTDILALCDIASNQLPLSLLWRGIEHGIQQECVKRGISILCYSPLFQGVLTGRYATPDDVPEGLARTRLYSNKRPQARHGEAGCEAEAWAAVAEVRKIAAELGQPMAHVALAWVRQQPAVLSLLLGARSPEELKQDLPALDLKLPDEIVRRLSEVTEPVKKALGNNPDMWQTNSRMR